MVYWLYHMIRRVHPLYIGITSSTAQGGSVSFRDRKLIGGVSSRDAWMAGEPTDGPRLVDALTFTLSISFGLFFHLSV